MIAPDDFNPSIGIAEPLAAGVRRIVAPNPSPMTYRGTNTYLLGSSDLAVIDPGPASKPHLDAILGSLEEGQRISHIFITHTHLDHSPLARPLAEATGAKIFAFGDALAGRSDVMQELARAGDIGGGEGVDAEFAPDIEVAEGDVIQTDDWALEVLHTPGHIGNHICLAWNDLCFTADHVMGWASSLVSPPDGDLTDFMASCEKLKSRSWTEFFPGHGASVTNPESRLNWLMRHRLSREESIVELLQSSASTAQSLAERIYVETPAPLLGAATRNVLAHLIDLYGKSLVEPIGALTSETVFRWK